MSHKAIFSCWDASSTVLTGWTGPNCARFGGEGTGSHCLIDVSIQQGVRYAVQVAASGKNASGAFWTGTFTDTSTGHVQEIGTLFHPNFGGHTGYGAMQVAAASFQEYFLSSGCSGQAVSSIGLTGPTFNNGTIAATQGYAGYVTDCEYSNVTPCLPGGSCHEHTLVLTGGGYTNRTTAPNAPLWGPGCTCAL